MNMSSRRLPGESVGSRIELADGEGFASDEVIQLVGGCSIKEAISDPSAGLDANDRSFGAGQIAKGNAYLSDISAMRSKASSTPSSPKSAPASIFSLYASRSNRRT
jgi:hypothetical protein